MVAALAGRGDSGGLLAFKESGWSGVRPLATAVEISRQGLRDWSDPARRRAI